MSDKANDMSDISKNIITVKAIRIEFKRKPKKLRTLLNRQPDNLDVPANPDPEIHMLPNFDDELHVVSEGKKFLKCIRGQLKRFDTLKYDEIADKFKDGQLPTEIPFARGKWTITLELAEGQLDHVIPKDSFDLQELDPLLYIEDVVSSATSYSKSIDSIRETLATISDPDLTNGFEVLQSARSDLTTASPFAKALVTCLLIPFKLLDPEFKLQQEPKFRKQLHASTKTMLSASRYIVNVEKRSKITSTKGHFRSISKLLRDVALFIKIYEIKRVSRQTVGAQFLERLAKYGAELDEAKRRLIEATTDNDRDVSKHLVIDKCIDIQFKEGAESTSLKLLFNEDIISTKDAAKHEWTLPCDISMLPNWGDTITIQDKANSKGAMTRLDYNAIASKFRTQRSESKAKGELRAHEALSFKAASFTVSLKVATSSIADFLTIEDSVSDPLLPESATEAITWVNSKLEDAQKLESVMENIPITEDALQVLESMFDTLANAHPLAKAVLTLLSIPYNLMKNEQVFKKNVKDLTDAMVTTCKCLTDVRYHVKITSAKDLFASIMKTLRDAVLFVSIYLGNGRFGQFVGAQFPNRLTQYADDLIKQKNDFQMAVIMQIAREVDGMSAMTHDYYLQKRLDPVKGAPLGEGCLEGTRVKILKEVKDWIYDCDSEKNILWIVGAPGAGKSTIATTIAKALARKAPYCAKFFCKRDDPNLCDPRQIWRTLAFSLADKHDGVKAALMRTLDIKGGDPQDYSVTEQFEELIKGSFGKDQQETKFRSRDVPYPVIIIDALDECYVATNDSWDSLLKSLTCWVDFKGPFRLIITSRNLVDIRKTVGGGSRRIDLTTEKGASDDSERDIMTFFDSKFSSIAEKIPNIPPDWPGKLTLRELTAYAAGLFVWADMVIKYVGLRTVGTSSAKRLGNVLNDIKSLPGNQRAATAERGQVDRLYARIVFEAFLRSEHEERQMAKRILAAVILAKKPLRKSNIIKLLSASLNNQDELLSSTESTLRELSPIIYISEEDKKLRVCHKTVSDFLLSRDRSEAAMKSTVDSWNSDPHQTKCSVPVSDFVLDCDMENRSLAFACLCALRHGLTNDTDGVVELLGQSMGQFYYARRYWIEHLESAGNALTAIVPSLKGLSSAMEVAYGCLERYSDNLKFVVEEAGALTRCLREAADFARQCIDPEGSVPNDSKKTLRHWTEHVDSARGHFQIAIIVRLAQDIDKSSSDPSDSFLRKRLQPADQTVLDDPCLEGTRTCILRQAKQWLESEDPEEKNILWIAGGPGAGKSAIATSLFNEFSKDRLCAKFFAKRDYSDRRDPSRVWRTLVYGLANLHVGLKGNIMDVPYKDSSRPENPREEQSQFRDLLVRALEDLHCLSGVLVIDALDECFSEEGNEQWKAFIQTLAGWGDLPQSLKLVVTSRDIPEIRSSLENVSRTISLVGSSDEANRDIKIFLRTKLTTAVTEEEIEELTEHACGSFIWARMVAELVMKVGSVGPVKDILAGDDHGAGNVDILYGRMLWDTLGQLRPMERNTTRSMLATIVLAKDPLRKSDLEALVASNNSSTQTRDLVDRLIKELDSIISVDDNQVLRIPHKSFADFLLDCDRCALALKDVLPPGEDVHSYLVNREEDSSRMTIACLQSMNTSLIFNVGGVETSHSLHKEPQDRTLKNIDSSLIYTCRFWAEHLSDCHGDSEQFRGLVEPLLETLLRKNLLYWFEVLSLANAVPSAKISLQTAEDFLKGHNSELAGIAKDARLFVEMFETPITTSIPHIYLSALPFCPSESWIARIYGPRYPSVLSVAEGRQVNWDDPVITVDAHTNKVKAVAFFPCGGKLASGSTDKTVRIWDARTGHALAAPFTGHDGGVCCVAISPNGNRIASGDDKGVLRIWDSDTGTCPLGSIKAHRDLIRSVAFSPNGSPIVTGSDDKTVKVWNVATGNLCLESWTGHTNDVMSVAFSIDGNAIVSGSNDGTICIWDALTGEPRMEPLTEDPSWVWCIALSPDGRYLASGGSDSAILLWDIAQGFSQISATPVEGACTMLSFSPDSSTMVSDFDDNALCFWSVGCGNLEQIGAPIYGHIDSIWTVSFAPDGLSVASGSLDSSIKIWTVPGPSTPNLPPAYIESLDARGHPVLSDESFIDRDGWMRTSRRDDAKVLFWVPEENKAGFWWPRNTVVIHGNVTKLDFRRFVHGKHWAECRHTSSNSEVI